MADHTLYHDLEPPRTAPIGSPPAARSMPMLPPPRSTGPAPLAAPPVAPARPPLTAPALPALAPRLASPRAAAAPAAPGTAEPTVVESPPGPPVETILPSLPPAGAVRAAPPAPAAAPPEAAPIVALTALDDLPTLPTLPTPAPATAPGLAQSAPATDGGDSAAEGPQHPMAHLLAAKPQTAASKRAADLRAARKKRSKRIKLTCAAVFLAVGAIAGPPLGKWLVDAINESGSVEQPEDAG